MPVYEFRCSVCRRLFEKLLPLDSPSEHICPDCGGKAVRIMSRSVGFVRESAPGFHDYRPGNCDRSSPCCGRDEPCDHRPCEES
jgi:putative FmdB family regulatory protein